MSPNNDRKSNRFTNNSDDGPRSRGTTRVTKGYFNEYNKTKEISKPNKSGQRRRGK
jgi:hypothetical protein